MYKAVVDPGMIEPTLETLHSRTHAPTFTHALTFRLRCGRSMGRERVG